MSADLLGVGQLVGGLTQAVSSALDPYFFTDQEKANAELAQQQQTTQQQAITATAQAASDREQTNRLAITYGLAGILGVSVLYLGAKLVSSA